MLVTFNVVFWSSDFLGVLRKNTQKYYPGFPRPFE